MNSQVRIRRSRGVVCGAALILLGLWGGLAPFVGPYFHFGFTPDKAWGYNTGRLYLSAVPGAAAALGGLAIMLTRSRLVGVTGSVLAALGGAWLIAGAQVTTIVLKVTSISIGSPLGDIAAGPEHAYLEQLALFTGVGALIVFVAAVACGRVSLLSAKDAADAADTSYYPDYQAATAAADPAAYPASLPESAGQFAASTGQFPAAARYPDSATDPFPEPATGQFPATQFPAASGQYTPPAGQFPPVSQQYTQPSAPTPGNPPFPDAPNPYSPEAPAQ